MPIRSAAADLGASSGRVMVGTLHEGRITLEEAARFPTPSYRDASLGYQCWDIDTIFAEVSAGLLKCSTTQPLHSAGVDSWAVDHVLLNERGNRVAPSVCYRDPRTTGMMQLVHSRMPARAIYSSTGIQFQPFNTIYQLAAVAQQHPEWLSDATRLLMIPDYLHYLLSGVAANEYTNATTTQMLRLDGTWDDRLILAAGLERSLMLPPVSSGKILGVVQLGSHSTKIIAPATHDTASAVAGTPLAGPDEAYISSGTWSLMGFESMEPIASPAAMRTNVTNEGGFERRFRVLKNLMGMWPLQRVCEELQVEAVDRLILDCDSVVSWLSLVDLEDPAFLNPPDMCAAIRAACRGTGQPEPRTAVELARCILESLALAYARVKRELEQLRRRKLTHIRIVGGGSRNRLLNQLCADACQVPVSAGPVEASALGNLSAQWIALGAIENLSAARAIIQSSFPCEHFTPRDTIPASVLERFEAIAHTPFSKEMQCS